MLAANPRKKRLQSCKYNLCAVSVEPLNAKGIPRSLCDLIANMMDCDNDIHGGEDAFQNMSQVRSDLQLMLDKPAISLRSRHGEFGNDWITALRGIFWSKRRAFHHYGRIPSIGFRRQ